MFIVIILFDIHCSQQVDEFSRMDQGGIKCPHSECGEFIKQNKRGVIPDFCPECSKPTNLDDVKICPNADCREPLEKNKKGVYPKHCPECGASTEEQEVCEEDRLCPDKNCAEPLKKNKKGVYPKHCGECGKEVDAPLKKPEVRVCHNVDCGRKLERNTDGLYPKECTVCGEQVDHRGTVASTKAKSSIEQSNTPPTQPAEAYQTAAVMDGSGSHSLSDVLSGGYQQHSADQTQSIAQLEQHPSTRPLHTTPPDPNPTNRMDTDAEKTDGVQAAPVPSDQQTVSHREPSFDNQSSVEANVPGRPSDRCTDVSDELMMCPLEECGAVRKRSKKGILAKFCHKCKLDFSQYRKLFIESYCSWSSRNDP